MNKQTPYYPQLEERDCGATCLRMVAERYGFEVSMERLREVTNTDANGTDLKGLEQGANQLGFETLAAEIPFDELTVGDFLPVILHWDRDHFVVVTEASYSSVTILDPASGKRTLSRDDFEQHRYGPGRSRAGLILRPLPETKPQTKQKASTLITPAVVEAGKGERISYLGIFAGSLFFLVALAAGIWILKTALIQAIDLQYREGWLQHVGAMLLAAAGIALASYLLRKQTISFAAKKGKSEISRLINHVKARASDLRKPIDTDNYLNLLSDSDNLRVWYSYSLSTLIIGAAVVICSLAYLFSIDYLWGAALLGCLVSIALVATYIEKHSQRNREIAQEAQLKQRQAMFEYANLLSEAQRLGGEKIFAKRLESSNESAEEVFEQVASEYSAEKQLVEVAMVLSIIALLALGFYRLGYAGLQVGELAFGFLLIFTCLLPFLPMTKAYASWKNLLPARLRLADLRPISAAKQPSAIRPATLTLAWKSPKGVDQQVTFPATCRLALVGSDESGKSALIEAVQGRPNDLDAYLYFDGNADRRKDLRSLGKLSVLTPESSLASGQLATSISMQDRLDKSRLEEAAGVVGIPADDSPSGLYTRVGFAGAGIEDETAQRALIARAVYHEADVLVLDKATSSLPTYDEGILMDKLIAWSEGRLLIINPSRVSAAYGCDLLVHLEEGELDGFGDHESLIEQRGAYYYEVAAAQLKIT